MLFTLLILLKKSQPGISNCTIKDHQTKLYSVSSFVYFYQTLKFFNQKLIKNKSINKLRSYLVVFHSTVINISSRCF